jgi:hypothetical protein
MVKAEYTFEVGSKSESTWNGLQAIRILIISNNKNLNYILSKISFNQILFQPNTIILKNIQIPSY